MSDADFTIDQQSLEGGVVRLTLTRAPVNALSAAYLDAFGAQIDALSADKSCRAILIGSPFKVLSAGLDLKEAKGFDVAGQHDIVRALNENFLKLYACPKPTVVAVNGAAIAGGLFFVLASDLRIAQPKALLGLAEVRVGVGLPVGPMEIARATLSADALRRLILTGELISGTRAYELGIIDEIVDLDALAARALAKATELAALPPQTFAKIKEDVRGATIAQLQSAMAATNNAPQEGWFGAETIAAMEKMIG